MDLYGDRDFLRGSKFLVLSDVIFRGSLRGCGFYGDGILSPGIGFPGMVVSTGMAYFLRGLTVIAEITEKQLQKTEVKQT